MGGGKTHSSDKLQRVLDLAAAALRDHNIPYALTYGTLLGLVRAGQMINGDDDVDFFVEAKHLSSAADAIASRYPQWLSVFDSPYYRRSIIEGVVVDLYAVKNVEGYAYDCWNKIVYPSDDIFPFRKLQNYSVPNAPERVLEYNYGENWRTPQEGKFRPTENVKESGGVCTQKRKRLTPFGSLLISGLCPIAGAIMHMLY